MFEEGFINRCIMECPGDTRMSDLDNSSGSNNDLARLRQSGI